MKKVRRKWLDPNTHGKGRGRLSKRYCSRCKTPVQSARILQGLNLCEYCVKELTAKRDGKFSCKGCGKISPEEVRKGKGFCDDCRCRNCGKPDPQSVRQHRLCRECLLMVGEICRNCGKEAPSQVKKHGGLCDACAPRE